MGRSSFRMMCVLVAVGVFFSGTGVAFAGSGGYANSRDPFAVRQKIRKDLPKINRCYETALRHEPELEGKVSVRFAIVRNGDVTGVRVVENTTGSPSVERCVAGVVSALRFPRKRYGKSVRFTFPFVFTPRN